MSKLYYITDNNKYYCGVQASCKIDAVRIFIKTYPEILTSLTNDTIDQTYCEVCSLTHHTISDSYVAINILINHFHNIGFRTRKITFISI